MDILEAQAKAQLEKKAHALATIVETKGVTPRKSGSKMLVFENGSIIGSVGGGATEKKVIDDALTCIANGKNALNEYQNCADENDISIGSLLVFIESIQGAPDLVVCGAGHVGACVIRTASTLGYRITAIDTRDTPMTAENVKLADDFILVDDFFNGLKNLKTGAGAFYLISTYGHAQDGEALAAALDKDAKYIGMTGSPTKIAMLFDRMREKDHSEARLSFVHAPVGLDIGGATPEEIAISIIAEMQMIRYGGTGRPLSTIA